ncbi:MAG: M20/M25/M40 family metallo-hydrolase [Pseudomonadota bacterium]
MDADTINRIADAGYNHGQVAVLAGHLTDQIGGRLTNSPPMRQAEKWTQQMFRSWGLKDVHAEAFEFGRGWWIESAHSRMIAPRNLELRSIPIAWTPATQGPLTAQIIVAPIRHVRDLANWQGKVKGKIVLVSFPDAPKDETNASFKRLDDAELGKLNAYHQPKYEPDSEKDVIQRYYETAKELSRFMAAEGALALVKMSRSDHALVHGEGYFYKVGETLALPEIEMAAEDYRRLARLAKVGDVKLEIDSRVHFEDQDLNGYNILADIPGKDPKAGYVMAGAHLDSWIAGDGAADNGAGTVVIMEAARILSSLQVKPKRSIRFALWAGEEQGLIGSDAYIERHLAKRPAPKDLLLAKYPAYYSATYPVTPQPGFNDLAAYFNLDNGSGKIRGIYAEGNFAAVPILRNWLAPFDSLGAGKVVAERTGGTAHERMAAIGLPAFQFIQDPLDYMSKVHHTNLDTFDHLRTEDLRQAAVILATVLLQAAESDAPIPRNVLPTQPDATDPFLYRDPRKD